MDFGPVSISPSDSNTAGKNYSLMCSASLITKGSYVQQSQDIPSQPFEWFFGPSGNAPLPSGLTTTATNNSITYTSTLQFFRLSQSLHTGNYTCHLGAGRLVNSAMVTVNGIISTIFSCVH